MSVALSKVTASGGGVAATAVPWVGWPDESTMKRPATADAEPSTNRTARLLMPWDTFRFGDRVACGSVSV